MLVGQGLVKQGLDAPPVELGLGRGKMRVVSEPAKPGEHVEGAAMGTDWGRQAVHPPQRVVAYELARFLLNQGRQQFAIAPFVHVNACSVSDLGEKRIKHVEMYQKCIKLHPDAT